MTVHSGCSVPRIGILHNIVSPHAVALFREIAKDPAIDIEVMFLTATARGRSWEVGGDLGFKYSVLWNRTVESYGRDVFNSQGREHFQLILNPTLPVALIRKRFDLVLAFGYFDPACQMAALFCKATGTPFMLWSGSTLFENKRLRRYTDVLKKLVIRAASGYVAYGTRARDYLISLGASADRIWISTNTVDVREFHAQSQMCRMNRVAMRRSLGLTASQPVILFVGRLVEIKGVQFLLDALPLIQEEIPDAALVLAGDGAHEPELRRIVSERKLNPVVFLGNRPLEALPATYALADVLVLPTYTGEVWGLVVNEAMAAELPVVATSLCGAAADLILPGENGYIVPPQDPRALSQSLISIVTARTTAVQMGKRSWEIIQRYDLAAGAAAAKRAIVATLRRFHGIEVA